MVLRRSTTRWTWARDLSNSARSTVTFMAATPVHWKQEDARGAVRSERSLGSRRIPIAPRRAARARRRADDIAASAAGTQGYR